MSKKKVCMIEVIGDDIREFIRGRISGIIVGVTNDINCYTRPIDEVVKTTGWWIFKRKRTIKAIYTFKATQKEIEVITDLMKRSYDRNGMRNFGFGVKVF